MIKQKVSRIVVSLIVTLSVCSQAAMVQTTQASGAILKSVGSVANTPNNKGFEGTWQCTFTDDGLGSMTIKTQTTDTFYKSGTGSSNGIITLINKKGILNLKITSENTWRKEDGFLKITQKSFAVTSKTHPKIAQMFQEILYSTKEASINIVSLDPQKLVLKSGAALKECTR